MEDLLDDLAENGRSVTSQITLLLLSTADRIQELTGEEFDATRIAEQVIDLYREYHELCPTAGMGVASSEDIGDDSIPAEFADRS